MVDHSINDALDATTFYEYAVTEQIRKATCERLLESESGTKTSDTFQTYTIRGWRAYR